MGGLGLGFAEHHAGHAQVLGEVHVALEAPQQVLAPSAESLDAAPDQRRGELLGRQRPRPARIEDLKVL